MMIKTISRFQIKFKLFRYVFRKILKDVSNLFFYEKKILSKYKPIRAPLKPPPKFMTYSDLESAPPPKRCCGTVEP